MMSWLLVASMRMSALRSMPWNRNALQYLDEIEKRHSKRRQHDERSEQQRRVEVSRGLNQHVAEALIGANEFACQRADHSERRCNLQATEDRRQCVRQTHLEKNAVRRRSHGSRELQHCRINAPQAHDRVDHNGKESDEERDRDLGNDAKSEP